MATIGIVKWFSQDKGYGFISIQNADDVFVHQNNIDGGSNLDEGDTVEFDVEPTDKGMCAKNCRKV